MSILLSMPWIRSRFSRNDGTQNEWLTSVVTSTSCVVSLTGSTSSGGGACSAVPVTVTRWSGYSNFQPHWNPVTWTVIGGWSVVLVTCCWVTTLTPNSTATIRIGVAV